MHVIHHRPHLTPVSIASVISEYSKKDEVSIKYMCSTEIMVRGILIEDTIVDVFYREDDSEHPKFGNRYFGIYKHDARIMICNADSVEKLQFTMVRTNIHELWQYSRTRHDFHQGDWGGIDGGRQYANITLPSNPQLHQEIDVFRIECGEFYRLSEL